MSNCVLSMITRSIVIQQCSVSESTWLLLSFLLFSVPRGITLGRKKYYHPFYSISHFCFVVLSRSSGRNNKHSTDEKGTYGSSKFEERMSSRDKKVTQEYGSTHQKDNNQQQSYILHEPILLLGTRFLLYGKRKNLVKMLLFVSMLD